MIVVPDATPAEKRCMKAEMQVPQEEPVPVYESQNFASNTHNLRCVKKKSFILFKGEKTQTSRCAVPYTVDLKENATVVYWPDQSRTQRDKQKKLDFFRQ